MSETKTGIPIPGFSKYHVLDGKIIEIATGNEMKGNKKGMAALTNDSDEPQVVNVADTVTALTPKVIVSDSPTVVITPAVSTEDGGGQPAGGTPAPATPAPAADPVAEKLKELRGNLKKAQAAMMKAKVEDLQAAHADMVAAQKELDDYKAAHPVEAQGGSKKKTATPAAAAEPPSEEQIAAQKAYDEAKAISDAANKVTAEKLAILKQFKTVKNTGDAANHAPKVTYEIAQQIRKEYAVGRYPEYPGDKETVQAIGERHGVSASTVNCIVNYINHKLKKGDTAYTPLINEYFPAEWKSQDGTVRSGAPYQEDGLKKDDNPYEKKDVTPAPTTAPAVTTEATPAASDL